MSNISILDKVRKLNSSLPKEKPKGNFASDIWYNFKEGDNKIRLVSEFIQVRGHYIAGNPKKKMRGLCIPTSFQGDSKLPFNINCNDWDIDSESEKINKTCTICRLNRLAKEQVRNKKTNNLSKDDAEFYFQLMTETSPRNTLKWNIIDRDDPFVSLDVNGTTKKVLGLKIAQIGMEAYKDIAKIFNQTGFDITDAEKGIDIIITKESAGRTSYSARTAMTPDGMTVLRTPFTAEEKALVPHDLKKICGKQVDQQKVLEALHLDLRNLLEEIEADVSAGNTKVESSPAVKELKEKLQSAPAASSTAPASKPAVVSNKTKAVVEDAADVSLDDDTSGFDDLPSDE